MRNLFDSAIDYGREAETRLIPPVVVGIWLENGMGDASESRSNFIVDFYIPFLMRSKGLAGQVRATAASIVMGAPARPE